MLQLFSCGFTGTLHVRGNAFAALPVSWNQILLLVRLNLVTNGFPPVPSLLGFPIGLVDAAGLLQWYGPLHGILLGHLNLVRHVWGLVRVL